MKITKTTKLIFTEEDRKVARHFRTEILHPICDLVQNNCSECPIKHCSDLENLMCEIQENGLFTISTGEDE